MSRRRFASAMSLSHSAVVTAMGFSRTACLPARSASSARGTCVLCGVTMVTSPTSDPFSMAVSEG